MSSGDVVFILAFIVLPTAILVSSVWAVVFVRRRPDRIVRDADDQQPVTAVEPSFSTTETRVLATIETPEGIPGVAAQSLADAEVSDNAHPESEPDPVQEPAQVVEADHEPEIHPLETPVLQTTEDLDDVVAAISAIDEQPAEDVPELEPEDDREPDAKALQSFQEPDVEQFETSELPVVDEHPLEADPEPQEQQPQRQRRKQSVKLLPGDQEVPRQRGRNRDVSRQVPQLNRAFRRKDEAQADPPPEPDAETGATTSRD